MSKTIEQHAEFKTSPKALFEMYLDSKKHSAAAGMPATLSKKVGGKWHAFGQMIGGTNLFIVPNQLIVQVWRSNRWEKEEISILTLRFSKTARGARVDLVHVGVPQHDHKGVSKGWPSHYWKPWKKYLESAEAL